ncbi:MAG TPA: mechanosensitive ion channel family protein [Stellaceae bacterium]|nr:mechanosensitive ion channel family protein [Stellaceae bacterium]
MAAHDQEKLGAITAVVSVGERQWASTRTLRCCVAAIILSLAVLSGAAAAPAKGSDKEVTTPTKIDELMGLLADPAVRDWLERQHAAEAAHEAAPSAETTPLSYFDSRVSATREHIVALFGALPDLPNQFERAVGLLQADIPQRGTVLLMVIVFGALGSGVEWLYRKTTQKIRQRLDALPMETVHDRLRLVAARFAFAFGVVVAFAIGSIGPFLALDWPPLLREIVIGYLVALLVTRIAVVVGRFLLAPDAERFRLFPTDTVAARFWCRRLAVFVGWFAFGWVTVDLLSSLGFSVEGRQLVAYVLGLGLLAIALESTWRRPVLPDQGVEAPAPHRHHLGRGGQNALLSIGIVLLWTLWVARVMPSFWLVLVIIVLPLANRITRRAVAHLLQPPGSPRVADATPSVITVCLERGLRALLIIGAAAVLAWGWGIDLVHLAGQDSVFARLVHGVLSAVIILLIADVLWQATRAAIDRKLASVKDLGQPNTEEARRGARLRTLLPIFRNVLFVVVIVLAVMMALAAMGVEIGPLIAGLGVLGVAVGFGAQSLVRDVIAGMFYLLDDAFRVGEYIQSGNYKGTVESFSFRSVRLRHQRGALYTVPFGVLGAVQNQSRDWVIDKMMVGITYDSDIDLAKKLIKQIGQELAKDPEFAPKILEPLKMQGVDAFGDFAVQLRMKMMTLPGENFVIRRKALAMIKKAFDANGIKFAFPTVQIAGDGEASAAATAGAAQRALELVKPAVP